MFQFHHVPGKHLSTANALSRSPTAGAGKNSLQFQEEVEAYVEVITSALPASEQRLETYRQAQAQDEICKEVQECCWTGWPDKRAVQPHLRPYWEARGSLSMHNNLMLYGHCIVVPQSLQRETLKKIHEGHQGVQRCRERVKAAVWWPGVLSDIQQKVLQCRECAKGATHHKEPLIVTSLPDYPW